MLDHVLGMFSRYIYLYIPVWSKFGVWGAFYVLLWLHVAVLVTLVALHALDRAPCSVLHKQNSDNTASVEEGIHHNKLHLRPLPQINKLRMSKKIGKFFRKCLINLVFLCAQYLLMDKKMGV